jgi:hypothetical protein
MFEGYNVLLNSIIYTVAIRCLSNCFINILNLRSLLNADKYSGMAYVSVGATLNLPECTRVSHSLILGTLYLWALCGPEQGPAGGALEGIWYRCGA